MSLNVASLKSRARGCLLAAACGDALGGPLEFMGPLEIERTHGEVRDFIGGGWLSLRPGEVTDDTFMMLDLARSLVENGMLDPHDVAQRWVRWMQSGPSDIGGTVSQALELIQDGTPWDEAGALVDEKAELSGGALGNGSIMRCSPVALAFHDDPASLVRASLDSSRITHANPVCQWATVALNVMVFSLLRGDGEGYIELAVEATPEATVRETLLVAADKSERDLKAGGHVLDTLESALWAFGNTDSLEEALVAAVNLGGDADTRGAVVGALAGAKYGEDAIPERWLDLLEGSDEIANLAEQLLRIGA